MKKQYDCDCYIICHNGSDIVHPSKIECGTYVATGQPNVEEFPTEEEWKARLTELGYDTSRLDPPTTEAKPVSSRALSRRQLPARGERFKGVLEKFKAKKQEEEPTPKRRGRPKKSAE
jgi:hypothetical protein